MDEQLEGDFEEAVADESTLTAMFHSAVGVLKLRRLGQTHKRRPEVIRSVGIGSDGQYELVLRVQPLPEVLIQPFDDGPEPLEA